MYRKGELRMCVVDEVYSDEPDPWEGKVYDARRGDDDDYLSAPAVELPHSCNAWVIGGPQQVRELIEDLQTMLATMEVTK